MLELYQMRRFLPLPYEAAAEPRLRRAQDRLQAGGPGLGWVRLPEGGGALLRLRTLAESIRSQGRTLLVVEEAGLRDGVRGVVKCLGGGLERVRFLSGLPAPWELEEAQALAGRGDAVLYAAGSEDTPAFRLLRRTMTERQGPEAGRCVLAAGDLASGGAGGFGLLTAAGLLPLAAAGVDTAALLAGAAEMWERCAQSSFENPAWQYAAVRRELCRAGYGTELLCCWDPALKSLLDWARQLFAASGGRGRRALFPAAVDYSREFRSVGRYIQEGPRRFFETVVRLEQEDGLAQLREATVEGTLRAHTDSGVPNLILRPGGRTAEALGGLIYFFQYACGLSACLLDGDGPSSPGMAACEARIQEALLEFSGPGGEKNKRVPAGIL